MVRLLRHEQPCAHHGERIPALTAQCYCLSTPSAVLLTDGKCVEDGSNNSEQKNGAQVVEEESVRHEVAGIQYNWREHVQEERVGGQG